MNPGAPRAITPPAASAALGAIGVLEVVVFDNSADYARLTRTLRRDSTAQQPNTFDKTGEPLQWRCCRMWVAGPSYYPLKARVYGTR